MDCTVYTKHYTLHTLDCTLQSRPYKDYYTTHMPGSPRGRAQGREEVQGSLIPAVSHGPCSHGK